jgi:hypothetical protein
MATSIEVHKETSAADHYTVNKGYALAWGGGPPIEGDGSFSPHASIDRVFADTSFRINEDTTLTSWSFYQANSTVADLPIPIGEVKLVILRLIDGVWIVKGVAEMTREIISKAFWEFPCELPVLRNDVVGLWLLQAGTVQVGQQTDLDSPGNTLLTLDTAAPSVDDDLGAGTASAGQVYSIAVRSAILGSAPVLTLWDRNAAIDDAFSYFQFVSGTNAFPEGNINNITNLFDILDTTTCDVATGVTTLNNVYYLLNAGGGSVLLPVERFIVKASAIPTGGSIKIYGSIDTAQTEDLAGAQAVAAGDWELLYTFDENSPTALYDEVMFHVGRKFKWVRMEMIGGSAASVLVAAFEIQVHDRKVTDGEPGQHPTAGLKDRFFFDSDSFTEGDARSAVLTGDIASDGLVVSVGNAPAAFFSQLVPVTGIAYLRRSVPRGSTNVMKRVTVLSVDASAKTVTLSAAPGESFQVGDFLDPEAQFFRFFAYDSDDVMFMATNWCGNHSAWEDWIRVHDVYTAAGN